MARGGDPARDEGVGRNAELSVGTIAQLGEIADLQAGVGFPVDLQGRSSGDYPVAKVGDISRVGRSGEAVISGADHYIDEGDLARLRARPIPLGSVLFAKIGEAIRQNHRVIAGCALLVDNNAMAAIPTNRVESRYLYQFLRTVDFYGLASATTVPALRKSELKRLSVPLPPLDEQKRIAGILDAADALRAKRREAIAQLDALLQSTFLDMFGDPVINPMGWVEAPFGDIVTDTRLGLVRSSREFGWDFAIPYVRMNALSSSGQFLPDEVQSTDANDEEAAVFSLRPGDFLFNTRNSRRLVGKVCVFPGPEGWLFNNNLMRIRFQTDVEPWVIAMQFGFRRVQRELEKRKSGTTSVFAIYWKSLRTLPVLVPPSDLQHRFSVIVESVEHQRAIQRAHLSELDILFASLQSRAFWGDL